MDSCVPAHHWLIDALPRRGSYHATCKNCGEERDFPENTTPFKFRMTKSMITPPVIEQLLGFPAGASPPMPAREEKTSG
jgi:hypothetical protein